MSTIAHFLIGVPGSGKSTLSQLISQTGSYDIVSTDAIREELYGGADIQGDWQTVETTALNRICTAFAAGKSVIYDATNFKRAFRIDFLQKVKKSSANLTWIAWHLNTPLHTCLTWNKQRTRHVPEAIIDSMYKVLQAFPPVTAEGFAMVNTIDVTSPKFSVTEIERLIQKLPRSIINSTNRTQHKKITFHRYSNLLDFERLLHLIGLIIKYSGLGNLQATNPSLLEKILGYAPQFSNDIQEITAVMAKLRGGVYTDGQKIGADLNWLASIGIISNKSEPINDVEDSCTATHAYSDKQPFDRLIGIIRLIVQQPFLINTEQGQLKTLAKALVQAGVIYDADNELDSIRKDIEKILKPYKILPEYPMRQGYFIGTAILSQSELIRVFDIIQSHANSLDDPLALEVYDTFKQRLLNSKLIETIDNIYPVRAIANSSKIDSEYLPKDALLNSISELELAIVQGKLLELGTLPGAAKYKEDEKSFFLAYPLQITFSNLAWYLGYECIQGDKPGLFKFERLDRLFLGRPQTLSRSLREQEKALSKLQTLLKHSAGIYLGYNPSDQQKFLSPRKEIRAQVTVKVELWFSDKIYPFITEATKRFLQIKMSPPIKPILSSPNSKKSIFTLRPTDDKKLPHRFEVILPKWSLDEFDFLRWIIGFGGEVKVIEPIELVQKVQNIGASITEIYTQ
ncbi:hypothetical protein DSM106972_008970 [Dulcicalothrix desertica PCC 7102]|uniref:WYL domain-containing protein n=1 Tax=Dulcicalothrix desertica PCC 7102 TaxID=232991 RepID=A0A433VRX9_9CYAN|nr:WYL domain-containing protein [Dulcicalothrix desertica]RUT08844.1 hypothetical protein DSM106972_008970 [Dulcicalothrix desertica PCC 7102]TWH44141.1 putative kinase [Dulcicalothrix desertica PCC 7102]